tara:strand:- start:2839 stop:4791 length:1953 start_codon:yes stop_codon:yes gene_type:complete
LKLNNSTNTYKKLPIKDVYPEIKSYQQLSFVGDLIFWVQSLPSEKKSRNAIFVRPFGKENVFAQNLTGNDFFIKSSFHGYGGKAYKCFVIDEKIYLIWIDQISYAIWCQIYKINNIKDENNNYLSSVSIPKKLTASLKVNFDSSFVLFNGSQLIGLLEKKDKDFLFTIHINKEEQELKILKEFDYFAGSLNCNNDQTFLSWIEWGKYNMSWQNNDLVFASLDSNGEISKIVKFKDKNINVKKQVSFFQPLWISKNILICSEDSSGWWNLLFLEVNNIDAICVKKRIIRQFFEYGLPEWISGISIFSGSIKNLFCLAKNKELWILEHYQNLSLQRRINLPFTCLKNLHVSSNKLICNASNSLSHEQLLEIDMNNYPDFLSKLRKATSKKIYPFSKAESYNFRGFNNKETYAWLYQPYLVSCNKPPLLVKAHSGPTSSFNGALNLEVQYWLSKGWFVAEVNYGGSSGYGKQYMERLNSKWGIVDSFDCIALAQSLIQKGLVDHSRIIIAGNSAGGFTALNSLHQGNIFKAAVCKYPVIDLNEMRLNTHRFEKNYLHSLVGNFNTHRSQYFERSPKNNIHKIDKPIILFHGKNDSVIDFNESVEFNKKLIEKNIYSKLFLFDDEGHGFKNINNKKIVLEKTQQFIQRVFGTKN